MIEAEGQIERRLSVPGAFRVEDDRSFRADQDVLRADVAMNQRSLTRQRIPGQCEQRLGDIRMKATSRFEIRLQPDAVEDIVIGEPCRHVGGTGGRGMDRSGRTPDHGSKSRFGATVAKLSLPYRVI